MEKNYKDELFTVSRIAMKYSTLKSARKLNELLEKENIQHRDRLGVWKFTKEYSHFEKYEEKQVGTNTKILARRITHAGVVFILRILEAKGLRKW